MSTTFWNSASEDNITCRAEAAQDMVVTAEEHQRDTVNTTHCSADASAFCNEVCCDKILPDADIIILALNRVEETVAAIASARAQIGVVTHIYILDQGSTADNLRCLQEVVAGDPAVTFLASRENLGVAGGRNLISHLGQARVIVGLDNDAEFATIDTVARLVAALDAEPRLGAIGCRIVLHSDGSDDLSSWGYPSGLRAFSGESFDTVTFVGAGHAIRRTAWEQAGGYDAKLFFCWEEFDFCLRAISLGWRMRYRGDILIRHKVSREQRFNWSTGRWYYQVRNRLYIGRKLGFDWLSLAPRAIGYLVKGTLNAMPWQTVRAIRASAAMSPRRAARLLPDLAASYVHKNDTVHRGSFLKRLQREILGSITAALSAASAMHR